MTFRHHSPHGTGGFPGALELEVSVSVLARSLRLDFRAQSDRRTPVSLTHHAYWRLWPDAAVGDHHLQVHADRWTPVDVEGCSTGELRSVEGGPMDFRSTRSMAEIIGGLGGLDHNLLVPGAPQLRELARLTHGASGRCLITRSTLPGLQIYTAERMDEGQVDAQGRPLGPEGAICLEPQLPPGGVHHAHFPSPWLEPGEVWEESIEWECLG